MSTFYTTGTETTNVQWNNSLNYLLQGINTKVLDASWVDRDIQKFAVFSRLAM